MSVSNLLGPNSNDIYCRKLICDEIETALPPYKLETYQEDSSGVVTTLPAAPDVDPNVSLWATADGLIPGTYNWVLDNRFNQVIDVQSSFINGNGGGTRSVGIAFQYQTLSDDSWTTSGLPFQWEVLNFTEACTVRLVRKLDMGHDFKAVRLLVAGENGSDIKYGFSGDNTRRNWCVTLVTSFL